MAIYGHERLLAGMRGNPSLGLIAPLRLAYSFGWGLESGAEGLVDVGLGPLLLRACATRLNPARSADTT